MIENLVGDTACRSTPLLNRVRACEKCMSEPVKNHGLARYRKLRAHIFHGLARKLQVIGIKNYRLALA